MGARGPKSKFIDEACPNKDCDTYGQKGQGNIAGNGTYQTRNGRVRKYVCRSCGTTFCCRKNTAFFDFKTKDEKVLLALKMIIKGMSMRAVAEVLETKLDTVRKWVNRAAEHTEEVNTVLLKEMKVSKVELDELWTFVQKKQFREWSSLKTMERGSGYVRPRAQGRPRPCRGRAQAAIGQQTAQAGQGKGPRSRGPACAAGRGASNGSG